MKYYNDIDFILKEVTGFLDKEVINEAQEYIENNEYTIAFELICEVLTRYAIVIPQRLYEKIQKVGIFLKLDPKKWVSIKTNLPK